MDKLDPGWMIVVVTFLVQVVGAAMNFGAMRAGMKWTQDEVQKLWAAHREQSAKTGELDVRVGRIEGVCEERHGVHHQPARPSRTRN